MGRVDGETALAQESVELGAAHGLLQGADAFELRVPRLSDNPHATSPELAGERSLPNACPSGARVFAPGDIEGGGEEAVSERFWRPRCSRGITWNEGKGPDPAGATLRERPTSEGSRPHVWQTQEVLP